MQTFDTKPKTNKKNMLLSSQLPQYDSPAPQIGQTSRTPCIAKQTTSCSASSTSSCQLTSEETTENTTNKELFPSSLHASAAVSYPKLCFDQIHTSPPG